MRNVPQPACIFKRNRASIPQGLQIPLVSMADLVPCGGTIAARICRANPAKYALSPTFCHALVAFGGQNRAHNRASIPHWSAFLRMASIRKHGDKWRAQVARQGVRLSKLFSTKREAQDWAARQEHLILNKAQIAAAMPLGDVFARYAQEVSPGKEGYRWEAIRLAKMGRDPIARISLRDLTPADLAAWRDRRLREVSPGSVLREMNLIGAVLSVACKEWGVIPSNPMSSVRKPSQPPPRDRLPTPDEIERMAHVAGSDLTNATARAFHAFRFACETAMRAGEIVGLRWSDISGNVAHLPKTKNGTPRNVPLSKAALDLLAELPRADPVFDLTSAQLDALFRKVRRAAAVEDLVFHDSRHMAITQLARRLDVMDLARMVGHRNISQLLSYYNAAPSDIASRLD